MPLLLTQDVHGSKPAQFVFTSPDVAAWHAAGAQRLNDSAPPLAPLMISQEAFINLLTDDTAHGVWINAGPNLDSSREGRLLCATVQNYYKLAGSLRAGMSESDMEKLQEFRKQVQARKTAKVRSR